MKRGHHFLVFFIPKKLMLKGFVIVLVLMPFSNKKSTIDLQRKGVYKVLLCILKRSCPRTFGPLFDLCSFVPKHLASQYGKRTNISSNHFLAYLITFPSLSTKPFFTLVRLVIYPSYRLQFQLAANSKFSREILVTV